MIGLGICLWFRDWSRYLGFRIRSSGGQSSVAFFQLIIGFSFSSQGNPKMIFWHPSPKTKNRISWILSPILMLVSTKWTIVPHLFKVPSTLYTVMGCSSFWRWNPLVRAKFWSMNVPPAPESTRALVSMVFFPLPLSHKIEIGKCIVLFEISANVTE